MIAPGRPKRDSGVRGTEDAQMSGTLYLVPNLLGVVPPSRVLPQHTIETARRITHWVVETPKPARAFLKALEMSVPIVSLEIRTFPEQSTADDMAALLAPAHHGADLGVLTDAGCPGIADPGALLVAAAHEASMRVVPLVGPSAILLALISVFIASYVPARRAGLLSPVVTLRGSSG